MRNILFILICVFCSLHSSAQYSSNIYKLSPYVRGIVSRTASTRTFNNSSTTVFVKTLSGNDDVLRASGCRVHARMGDVFVVEIPINNITNVASLDDVSRIEASRQCTVQLDTTQLCSDYARVHAGIDCGRAYTGRGVIMGIMDVGFDFTNPNFYTRDMSDYRIRSFWDMLSPEKDPQFVVGREYVGKDEILSLKHSADNLIISHGTHTLGIAAGSGYDSNYIGVATESDICLVNNAVVDDSVLIAPEDRDKYTSATDALGFKYIFDYATSQNKPCVISFSEGSRQSFSEDNVLFFEALNSLVGPGRILVASAGNEGVLKTSMVKESDAAHCGSFIYSPYKEAYFALKASGDYDMVIKSYGEGEPDVFTLSSTDITLDDNDEYHTSFVTNNETYNITMTKYPSAYDSFDTVYEMLIVGNGVVGARALPVSVELIGEGTEVQMYAYNCIFKENDINPDLCDGSSHRSILVPGSAPAVICVGASSYRGGFVNYKGEYKSWDNGSGGVIAPYSSKGPTFDGRIKPEVVAPGTNVVSSYSSYYIEACPDAFDTQSDVSRYEYNGRTYSWNANTGTSMSSPVVGGIIALWLEANPNLSPDDIRYIFAATCSQPDASLTYPNNIWGHGEINAHRGLCHILDIDGIEGVTSEARDYYVITKDDGFDIRFHSPLMCDADVDIFTLSSTIHSSHHLPTGIDSYHISTDMGVYIVRVKYDDGSYQSLLVRV